MIKGKTYVIRNGCGTAIPKFREGDKVTPVEDGFFSWCVKPEVYNANLCPHDYSIMELVAFRDDELSEYKGG